MYSTSKAKEQCTDSAPFVGFVLAQCPYPQMQILPFFSLPKKLPQSESLKLMERGHEAGRVGSLGSAQEPHQTHMEHMQIYTPAYTNLHQAF